MADVGSLGKAGMGFGPLPLRMALAWPPLDTSSDLVWSQDSLEFSLPAYEVVDGEAFVLPASSYTAKFTGGTHAPSVSTGIIPNNGPFPASPSARFLPNYNWNFSAKTWGDFLGGTDQITYPVTSDPYPKLQSSLAYMVGEDVLSVPALVMRGIKGHPVPTALQFTNANGFSAGHYSFATAFVPRTQPVIGSTGIWLAGDFQMDLAGSTFTIEDPSGVQQAVAYGWPPSTLILMVVVGDGDVGRFLLLTEYGRLSGEFSRTTAEQSVTSSSFFVGNTTDGSGACVEVFEIDYWTRGLSWSEMETVLAHLVGSYMVTD